MPFLRRVGTGRTYISVVGQDDNLGDSVLRRGLIRAARETDMALHLYVGSNSQGYVANLGIRDSDSLYRSRRRWACGILMSSVVRRTAIVLNAGESQFTGRGTYLGRHLNYTLRLARFFGAPFIHTGVGLRHVASLEAEAMARLLRAAAVVSWRDQESRNAVGVGTVAPDWALFAGTPLAAASTPQPRQRLVLSMRGDRPFPSDAWLAGVRHLAQALELDIAVVCQVGRDSDRSQMIAATLGAASLGPTWTNDHRSHEASLRAVYRTAAVVVSDRLHALIIAADEGAFPLGLTDYTPEKLRRTLEPLGLSQSAIGVNAFASPRDLYSHVTKSIEVWRLTNGIDSAREEVKVLADLVSSALTTRVNAGTRKDVPLWD